MSKSNQNGAQKCTCAANTSRSATANTRTARTFSDKLVSYEAEIAKSINKNLRDNMTDLKNDYLQIARENNLNVPH